MANTNLLVEAYEIKDALNPIPGRIESLKKQIIYIDGCLSQNLENWERKEYLAGKKECQEQLDHLLKVSVKVA